MSIRAWSAAIASLALYAAGIQATGTLIPDYGPTITDPLETSIAVWASDPSLRPASEVPSEPAPPTDAELRSQYAEALSAARRASPPELGSVTEGSPSGASAPSGRLTVPSTTSTTRPWRPADECGDVTNPGPVFLSDVTMSWCPAVAVVLDATDKWEPGYLGRLMVLMECESGGDPGALSPAGAANLLQGMPHLHQERSLRYLGRVSDIWNVDDHLVIYVNFFVDTVDAGGSSHWSNCSGWADTDKARNVRATLTNMGAV